jgi:lipid-binding SYLF domain-containing protein
MHASRRSFLAEALLTAAALTAMSPCQALAAGVTAAEVDTAADEALKNLYESEPAAKDLAEQAVGILVFPTIVKGGLGIGGAAGDGVLRVGDKSFGYYTSVAASFGLQIGVQSFSYALFFMSDDTLQYLKNSDGWEIGVGPSVVVVDAGVATKLSTTTAKDEVYAFIYGQQGLMAGLGIEGSKITEFTPDK